MRSQFKERKKHGLGQYFKLIKYESRNKTEKMTREIEETEENTRSWKPRKTFL